MGIFLVCTYSAAEEYGARPQYIFRRAWRNLENTAAHYDNKWGTVMKENNLVITGMGAVTPVGIGVSEYWNALKEGTCGVGKITRFDAGEMPVQIAAELKDFDPTAYMPKTLARTIRAALPDMLHRQKGSIVIVSSMWGERGASCESHYAASKAALIGLSKSLALELGPSGIRVNCVAPGVIGTDMNAMHGGDVMQSLADETPLERIGRADEVADSILYLCSEKASFVTGQVLGVTGGF